MLIDHYAIGREFVVTQLVIHLGLPKTATTTLQTHFFPQLPGYLGKFYPGASYSSPTLNELQALWFQGTSINARSVWFASLEPWIEELVASDDDILLWSEENLTQWRSPEGNAATWPVTDPPGALARRGSHPIAGFLKHLRELLPQDIELKTMLTLRNQSDWTMSLAAQLGVLNDRFVKRLIRDDDAFLNYYAITKDLENLNGPENHLTLLYENGLNHNFQRMLRFSGYSPADIQDLRVPQAQENVRRTEKGWIIAGAASFNPFERTLATLRTRSSFVDKHLSYNKALRRTFRPLLGFEARQRLLSKIPTPRTAPVSRSLTDHQMAAIRKHCEKSNAQLAAHLDLDLRALGY